MPSLRGVKRRSNLVGDCFALLAMTTVFFSTPLFAFDVEGTIKVEAPYPVPAQIEVPKDHVAHCGAKRISTKLKISPEGALANAVIEVKGIPESAKMSPASQNPVLDQKDCEFSPHILVIPEGATVNILNSEPVIHNVRAFDEKAAMLFNLAMQPEKIQMIKKRFDENGKYIVRCGIHKWMHAFVIVQEHPYYAVSDSSGRFKITGLPEGEYTLNIWHEELGDLTAKVSASNPNVSVVYPTQKK